MPEGMTRTRKRLLADEPSPPSYYVDVVNAEWQTSKFPGIELTHIFNRDVENLGILGLVVRTRNSLRRWVTQPIAREFPWTWKYGNFRYLEGLLAVALGLAALRALCSFGANIAAPPINTAGTSAASNNAVPAATTPSAMRLSVIEPEAGS